MDFKIEQFPTQPIVYMRRTGEYGIENLKLMEELKKWAKQKGLLKNTVIYGIAHDGEDTPAEHRRYDVCLVLCDDLQVDDAVIKGKIPAGKYAVYTVLHTSEAVESFWSSLALMVEESGLTYDITRLVLERYEEKQVEAGMCEFCVPIR